MVFSFSSSHYFGQWSMQIPAFTLLLGITVKEINLKFFRECLRLKFPIDFKVRWSRRMKKRKEKKKINRTNLGSIKLMKRPGVNQWWRYYYYSYILFWWVLVDSNHHCITEYDERESKPFESLFVLDWFIAYRTRITEPFHSYRIKWTYYYYYWPCMFCTAHHCFDPLCKRAPVTYSSNFRLCVWLF